MRSSSRTASVSVECDNSTENNHSSDIRLQQRQQQQQPDKLPNLESRMLNHHMDSLKEISAHTLPEVCENSVYFPPPTIPTRTTHSSLPSVNSSTDYAFALMHVSSSNLSRLHSSSFPLPQMVPISPFSSPASTCSTYPTSLSPLHHSSIRPCHRDHFSLSPSRTYLSPSIPSLSSPDMCSSPRDHYLLGYRECAVESLRYLSRFAGDERLTFPIPSLALASDETQCQKRLPSNDVSGNISETVSADGGGDASTGGRDTARPGINTTAGRALVDVSRSDSTLSCCREVEGVTLSSLFPPIVESSRHGDSYTVDLSQLERHLLNCERKLIINTATTNDVSADPDRCKHVSANVSHDSGIREFDINNRDLSRHGVSEVDSNQSCSQVNHDSCITEFDINKRDVSEVHRSRVAQNLNEHSSIARCNRSATRRSPAFRNLSAVPPKFESRNKEDSGWLCTATDNRRKERGKVSKMSIRPVPYIRPSITDHRPLKDVTNIYVQKANTSVDSGVGDSSVAHDLTFDESVLMTSPQTRQEVILSQSVASQAIMDECAMELALAAQRDERVRTILAELFQLLDDEEEEEEEEQEEDEWEESDDGINVDLMADDS